ncbi:divalent-cation tolerance protein CutA [Desulfolithobacter sp.]
MNKYIQVVTTFEDYEEAKKVAEQLVSARLAACVQIVPNCLSIYRWQGKVESAAEIVCTMKSRRDLFSRLSEAIRSMHSYEVPEIIATEIIDASQDYLDWLDQELFSRKDD